MHPPTHLHSPTHHPFTHPPTTHPLHTHPRVQTLDALLALADEGRTKAYGQLAMGNLHFYSAPTHRK